MKIGKNIAFNYLSQGYAALIGIFVLPWYLKIMGAEAYGLIGFFTLLQSIFALLDLGLTSTMTRQSARLSAKGVSEEEYLGLFKLLRLFFVAIGIVGVCALLLNSGAIARLWLNNTSLSDDVVTHSLMLIAVVLGLRWVSGLYRGIVSGFERQVWLGNFNIAIATLRFILPIPILLSLNASPLVYFAFQIFVALIELIILVFFVNSIIPKVLSLRNLDFDVLRPHLAFALKISFLSVVWVLVTQIDKLVLSKTLSLTDYGYFSFGVMAASIILFISGPVGTALLPRLTALYAENKIQAYYEMYGRYTKMVASLVFPAAMILLIFPAQVLQLWSADSELAHKVAPVLALYAMGNALLAVSAFPYYLQYSVGNMRLHIYGNLIFLIVVVPSIAFASIRFGMYGAAWVWLTVNILYFLLWVPVVHHQYFPGQHLKWLFGDCLKPLALSAVVPLLAWLLLGWDYGPVVAAIQLLLIGVVSVLITPYGRSMLRSFRSEVSA